MSNHIKPGDIVNQYRIVKMLGKGQVAEVYLATHTFLNIDRAIKVLRKDSSQMTVDLFQQYCERYKLEWQLAARVYHPNLIGVYDLFEEDGVLFAVVEYGAGGTLADKLESGGKQTEDWVVDIIRDCAQALEQLHQLSNPPIIHCYVNPKTIVLDMNGRAKITNFGKARAKIANLRQNALGDEDKSNYSWKYQAPEFARDKVAPTTDVYSLGCVAFEMLTGQDVVRARVRSPRQIEPSVPEWLDQIVTKCLADDPCFSKLDADNPHKRYYDMTQLLKALSEPQYTVSNKLHDNLVSHFSQEDLKTMCLKLDINYENIGGDTLSSYAREIIRYFQRQQNVGELIEYLRRERPHVDW